MTQPNDAPRLTIEDVTSVIEKTEFALFYGRLTLCILTLRNGFLVTGESSCVSVENFDSDIGRELAYKDAVKKVWLLEGYLLRERTSTTPANESRIITAPASLLRN
jgi:hypothetical protein